MTIEVTQEDRERAEAWQHLQAMKICSGVGDYPPLAEELARHRQAAYEKGQADARRDEADWLALALL